MVIKITLLLKWYLSLLKKNLNYDDLMILFITEKNIKFKNIMKKKEV